MVIRLPAAGSIFESQMGNRKTCETRFGLGTTPRRALVAYLSTCTRRGTFERSNCGGVVMRFNLHHRMDHLGLGAVYRGTSLGPCRCLKPLRLTALHNGCVIRIGNNRTKGLRSMRFTNHAKQRFGLGLAINDPLGIENLVTTMLTIGLSEHHEFNICWIAGKLGK